MGGTTRDVELTIWIRHRGRSWERKALSCTLTGHPREFSACSIQERGAFLDLERSGALGRDMRVTPDEQIRGWS